MRVLKSTGEAVSATGTHLGHNLPDAKGNRYCINLVSVAGLPRGKELGGAVANDAAGEAQKQSAPTVPGSPVVWFALLSMSVLPALLAANGFQAPWHLQ